MAESGDRARSIILCGLPGSGKTTLGKALESPPTAEEQAEFDEPLVSDIDLDLIAEQ